MVDQLARPKDKVEVYWFSEQPNGYINDELLDQYDSGRLGFPTPISTRKRPTYSTTSTTSSTPWPMRWASTAS